MTKKKRLGDAAKPGNYNVNSAFCESASHLKFEAQRLERDNALKAAKAIARKQGRSIGIPEEGAVMKKAKPSDLQRKLAPDGVPASVGRDGKVYMSKAARKRLKKQQQQQAVPKQ